MEINMSKENELKFKELQTKSQKVSESAIKINAQIENAQQNHKKLQETAQLKFQTSNLDELKQLLANWKKENIERLTKFEADVNKVEADVNEKIRLIKEISQG
jgi:hypothetical protein